MLALLEVPARLEVLALLEVLEREALGVLGAMPEALGARLIGAAAASARS